jgi:succinate-semialdehyde dehydrogenase/glutarate-semialdehyde dehydrogenase
MPIKSINPATGKEIQSFPEHSPEEIEKIVTKAGEAFKNWRNVAFSERGILMKKAAAILRDKSNIYGRVITQEMGKPLSQAIAEVEKCALVCDYYAENAEKILTPEVVSTDASESYLQFEPLGVILAVMPWNYPFWQVFRFAVPALMAGNVALLKHASNVPLSALAIEEIFSQAGFPSGTFTTLLSGPQNIEQIISLPAVKGVTLTGSEAAGRQVAAISGKYLKKIVLELGGSDPFIVLPDADLETAARAAIAGRLINNGQSCVAAKRFIIVKSVYTDFEQKLVKLMRQVKVGDPLELPTELGPLAREDLRVELERQVKRSCENGAVILCGGQRIKGPGFYFQPTLLANVHKGMPAYDEELFGPVAALIQVEDEEEAVNVANDTAFGLGASIWTGDRKKAVRLANRLESGMVFINGIVKSDPRLTFGGIKNSGYGRELADYGIKEFVNIKTVWIK